MAPKQTTDLKPSPKESNHIQPRRQEHAGENRGLAQMSVISHISLHVLTVIASIQPRSMPEDTITSWTECSHYFRRPRNGV